MIDTHGAALLVTPLLANRPRVLKKVNPDLDRLVEQAMAETLVIKSKDDSKESEESFTALWQAVRGCANQQPERFTWSLYRNEYSGRLHFQLTKFRGHR